jgi:bifunctional DNA-binding transcriptional regulator/antitoxin component of YhaV-PrlF toxin-antitoxin module
VVGAQPSQDKAHDDGLAGFATVDDRGRVALSKAARQALNLRAGSSLAYVVVDGTIVFIPQDEHLARLSEHAAQILENAGLTVEDLLAELPAVREEILREDYGDAFVDELARRHAAVRGAPGDMQS